MSTTIYSAENVIQHHLKALASNDLDALMEDYTEQSELWTTEGIITGVDAISAFFSYAFTLLPKKKTALHIQKMIVRNSKIYIVWNADSPVVHIPFAVDTFEVQDGKIIWQTVAFQSDML